MKNRTSPVATILSHSVKCHFSEQSMTPEHADFEHPFSLLNKVLNCSHARSEVFAFEKGHEQNNRKGKAHATDLNASGIFRRIVTAPLNGLRKQRPEKTCQMGKRHVISNFPAFNQLFPGKGLALGRGAAQYWVRPLKVEYASQGSRVPSEGDRVISTFWIEFKDGTKGETGFMDLIKCNGRYSRWHIYPSGDVTSADLYSEHRINHDAFRSLMANILKLEFDSVSDRASRTEPPLSRSRRGNMGQVAVQDFVPLTSIAPAMATAEH